MVPSYNKKDIEANYARAQKQYLLLGVDTDQVLERLSKVNLSLHCWQGDDVNGFEVKAGNLTGGGIMATGNYPGRARNGNELRADLDQVLALLPGNHRVNLHAIYAETAGKVVDRNQLTPAHFTRWMDWAKSRGIKLDFNPTFFAHPKANDGYTLSHRDPEIRTFWVNHAIACRKIAAAMAQKQHGTCYINHWIPDGCKDTPADRWSPRARLKDSLDRLLAPRIDKKLVVDVVESKLFGLGSEDYVVGSHEFYLSYAMTTGTRLCLDMGHFHPTETIHDKLSSILTFQDLLVLHVSRPIRWDSDHVVILNDDVRNVFTELVRGNALSRAVLALDFFDASINRIGAWTIGARSTLKAILIALLEPTAVIQKMEAKGDGAGKLAMIEEMKALPWGLVWDYHCLRHNVPVGTDWINSMKHYEATVTSKR
jgi:L-rhamnose isomerase